MHTRHFDNLCDVMLVSFHRKDFKAESQFQQHLSSKAHKKKVQELNKKSAKKKNKKVKSTQKMSSVETTGSLSNDDEDDQVDDEEDIEISQITLESMEETQKETTKQQQQQEEEEENEEEDSENDENELLNRFAQSVEITSLHSNSDSESDSEEELQQKYNEVKISTPILPSSQTKKKPKGRKVKSKPITQSGLLFLFLLLRSHLTSRRISRYLSGAV